MAAGNPYETPTINTSSAATASRRTVSIKRLDVMSCGVMLGVLYAVLGLFVGGVFSLMALGGAAAGGADMMAGLIGGVGAVIILPLMYGVMGFLGGLIGALLYNLCASLVCGIKFDLE